MRDAVQADTPYLLLFVPACRPDRFAGAAASGANAVIIDLEDSVPPCAKVAARDELAQSLAAIRTADTAVFIRINAVGTEWHEGDLASVTTLPIRGVMLSKCQRAVDVDAVRQRLPGGRQVIALIETPLGLSNARAIAVAAERLAFGSLDYSISIGAEHSRHALLTARAELVLASTLAGKAGPIDGVTANTAEIEQVFDDARYGSSLGMTGKLLIHPRQVAAAKRGFLPTAEEIERAHRALSASGSGVAAVDGMMVDAPVLAWAKRVLARAQALNGGS